MLNLLSVSELSAKLQSREISAREVLDAHLVQIERINSKVNAIVTLDGEGAYRQANAIDARRMKGEALGPLAGLPIACKDMERVKGMRTTFGSPIYKDFVPDQDTLMVERFRRHGLIIIGKTNTPEFALGSQTFNNVFGKTLNPWDLTRTCGGSSGGAGHYRPRAAHVLALPRQRPSCGQRCAARTEAARHPGPLRPHGYPDRTRHAADRRSNPAAGDLRSRLPIFNRCMNLNAWLHQNGYLVLKEGKSESGDWFEDVDWSRTRAYTMGLNGLYMNIKGREREGIVEAGAEAEALKEELRSKLDGLVDPASGKVGITGMFDCDAVYAGPYVDNAPDLIVGYGEGFRASWDSVMGKVTTAIFEDNLKAWSGDHCVDPRLVPGVLFSNRKIAIEKPAIVDVAPTVMKLFGLELPTYFDGKPWAVSAAGSK